MSVHINANLFRSHCNETWERWRTKRKSTTIPNASNSTVNAEYRWTSMLHRIVNNTGLTEHFFPSLYVYLYPPKSKVASPKDSKKWIFCKSTCTLHIFANSSIFEKWNGLRNSCNGRYFQKIFLSVPIPIVKKNLKFLCEKRGMPIKMKLHALTVMKHFVPSEIFEKVRDISMFCTWEICNVNSRYEIYKYFKHVEVSCDQMEYRFLNLSLQSCQSDMQNLIIGALWPVEDILFPKGNW